MHARTRTIAAGIATLVTAAGLLAAAGPARAARPVTEPSLVGSAQLYRLTADDVHISVDAHGFATGARGEFHIRHRFGEQDLWADAKVDCLVTGGPVAVVTGVVTATNYPVLLGRRRGITVYDDGRHDRVGYSWVLGDDAAVAPCLSSAPIETTRTGNFVVEHWTPPLPR